MESHSISTLVDIETSQYAVKSNEIEHFALAVCRLLGVEAYELCIRLVSPDEIHQLNMEFRGIDKPTDVLSFPQVEWAEPRMYVPQKDLVPMRPSSGPPEVLGDIAICLDIARDQAKDIGQSIGYETCFLIVHGILHLCGHDHEDPEEEAVMLGQQRLVMSELTALPGWTNWASSVVALETAHA